MCANPPHGHVFCVCLLTSWFVVGEIPFWETLPHDCHCDSIYSTTIIMSSTRLAISTRFHVLHGDLKTSKHFVVVYKPPGLICQGRDGELSVERLISRERRSSLFFPHQLDKDAQGLLVVCFNKTTCAALSQSIANRQWIKRYRIMAQLPACLPMVGHDERAMAAAPLPADQTWTGVRLCHLQSPLLPTSHSLLLTATSAAHSDTVPAGNIEPVLPAAAASFFHPHTPTATTTRPVLVLAPTPSTMSGSIGSLSDSGLKGPLGLSMAGTLRTLLVPRDHEYLDQRQRLLTAPSTRGPSRKAPGPTCPPQGCAQCQGSPSDLAPAPGSSFFSVFSWCCIGFYFESRLRGKRSFRPHCVVMNRVSFLSSMCRDTLCDHVNAYPQGHRLRFMPFCTANIQYQNLEHCLPLLQSPSLCPRHPPPLHPLLLHPLQRFHRLPHQPLPQPQALL